MCVAAHGLLAPRPSSESCPTYPERWLCSRARRSFFDSLAALDEPTFQQVHAALG